MGVISAAKRRSYCPGLRSGVGLDGDGFTYDDGVGCRASGSLYECPLARLAGSKTPALSVRHLLGNHAPENLTQSWQQLRDVFLLWEWEEIGPRSRTRGNTIF